MFHAVICGYLHWRGCEFRKLIYLNNNVKIFTTQNTVYKCWRESVVIIACRLFFAYKTLIILFSLCINLLHNQKLHWLITTLHNHWNIDFIASEIHLHWRQNLPLSYSVVATDSTYQHQQFFGEMSRFEVEDVYK